jgi:hypothetical protein
VILINFLIASISQQIKQLHLLNLQDLRQKKPGVPLAITNASTSFESGTFFM